MLGDALTFAARIMNLAHVRQELFSVTMECLEAAEMPLCYWIFSRLTPDTRHRIDLYDEFVSCLRPLVPRKATESASFWPVAYIVAVLFASPSSRTDDLFANLNEVIIECGRGEQWELAWESLVGLQAYDERMLRVRKREEQEEKNVRNQMSLECLSSSSCSVQGIET